MSFSQYANQILNSRYRIIEKIGQGGMGDVFKAKDNMTGEIVAIKHLLKPSHHLRQRFVREYTFLKKVEHPQLVKVLDIFTVGRDIFMVQEMIFGETLEKLLQSPEKEFPLLEKLAVLNKIARAVEVLHHAGIIHRDIKPDNIMVDSLRKVKLLDLGIGKDTTGAFSKITMDEGLLGTLSYMSPEQANGVYGPAGDIFSLAVTCYQLLLWQPNSPFHHHVPMTVLFRIANHHPAIQCELSEKFTEIPEIIDKLALIVETGMDKNARKRTMAVGEIAEEFARLHQQIIKKQSTASDSSDLIQLSEPLAPEMLAKLSEFRCNFQEKRHKHKKKSTQIVVTTSIIICLVIAFVYFFPGRRQSNLQKEEKNKNSIRHLQPIPEHFEQAKILYERGKYQEALEEIEKISSPNARTKAQKAIIQFFRTDGLRDSQQANRIMAANIKTLEKKSGPYCSEFLSYAYILGIGTKIDIEKGLYWLRKGSEQQNAACLYHLALIHFNGKYGLPADERKAFEYLKKAIDLKYGRAAMRMGKHYQDKGDKAEAEKWFKKAKELKNPLGMFLLSQLWKERFAEKSKKLLLQAAEHNDLSAMFHLGKQYVKGEIVDQNKSLAKKLLRKSVQNQFQPHDQAYLVLGNIYKEEKNYLRALTYYQKAVAYNPGGIYESAKIYYNFGQYQEALDYYQKYKELVPRDLKVNEEIKKCRGKLSKKEWDKSEKQRKRQAGQFFRSSRKYFRQKKYGKALDKIEKAIKLRPIPLFLCHQAIIQFFREDGWRNEKQAEIIMKDVILKLQSRKTNPPYACYALGLAYLHGIGTPVSREKAVYWLKQNTHDVDSLHLLILAEFRKDRDIKKAQKAMERAAGDGSGYAMRELAKHYYKNYDLEKNKKNYLLAEKWCVEAEKQKNYVGCKNYATYLKSLLYKESNPKQSLKLVQAMAQKHTLVALEDLAWRYWKGDGVPVNREKTAELLAQSMNNQYSNFYMPANLGLMAMVSFVNEDYPDFIYWMSQAVAETRMPNIQELKKINTVHYQKALKWIDNRIQRENNVELIAAKAYIHYALEQKNLALQNFLRAFQLHEDKHLGIMLKIGLIYYDQKKNNNALQYLLASSELGEITFEAEYKIGMLFYRQRDYDNALKWFRQAEQKDRGFSFDIIMIMGKIYSLKGNNTKALEYWRIAKQNPAHLLQAEKKIKEIELLQKQSK